MIQDLSSIGGELGPWREVSERPGKEPFAKEAEYKVISVTLVSSTFL